MPKSERRQFAQTEHNNLLTVAHNDAELVANTIDLFIHYLETGELRCRKDHQKKTRIIVKTFQSAINIQRSILQMQSIVEAFNSDKVKRIVTLEKEVAELREENNRLKAQLDAGSNITPFDIKRRKAANE